MKELIEIIGIIKSGRVIRPEKIKPFDKELEPYSHGLYYGLMANKYASDDEAREGLYGKNMKKDSTKGILHKYNVLKKRLKERIFVSVLYPAEGEYPASQYSGAFIYCYQNFIIGRMLLFFGAAVSGKRLMYKVLVRAREFEIYDIAMLCVLALRRRRVFKGNAKEFASYNALFKEFHRKVAAEAKMEEIYYELELPFATKLHISPAIMEATAEGLKKAERIHKNYPTNRVRNIYTDIKILESQVRGALAETVEICEEAIAGLKSNDRMYSKGRNGSLLIRKIDSLINLNKPKEAYKCAAECLAMYLPGTQNWYSVQELLFLAQINDANLEFEKIRQIYSACINHTLFKSLEKAEQEKWHIYGGYLWFVLTYYRRQEEREAIFGKGKWFDITSLSNLVTATKGDKKGIFVSFMILKTLLYKQENRTIALETSIDSLKNYLTFNLRADNNRGRNFIKLLVALFENDYKLLKNTKQIKKLSTALARTEPKRTAAQRQIEVISYSILWKIADDMVTKK